ncbi:alpha beta hydrolase [Stylonychia lemnae]|uniref:Alpha beta hydrolase n=1 Tax=Stylonychia lemnae TaxID=5949 RepID=A0A078AU35_STYLE|nr:alpha beta hydrolase [Stylonychia lemnae]|eukprot:CDW84368.1 alpha beta hydrolase [Stylonychia lemnae]
MRQSTTDVELNGFKITAVDDVDSHKDLIFLHGLLGQGKNWRSFALNDVVRQLNYQYETQISSKRNVYLVDIRNHGESDHHMSMTYREMADDVLRYADTKQINRFSLLGHNLGAKVAMTLACSHPDRVNTLISIDTAPKSFANDKQIVNQTIESIQKIKNLNIEGKTRKTAMDVIQQSFKDPGIANFVASNLVYDESNDRKFVKWCVDLDAILLNYENIIGFDDKIEPYQGPSLFLNGSLSVKHDESVYKKHFPNCTIETVEGAGHYLHTDKPKIAVTSIARFLDQNERNERQTAAAL